MATALARIDRITPATQPLWGRMDAAQMLAHCQALLQVYVGEMKLKQSFIGVLFGRMAKKKFFGDKPWPQSLPTAREFHVANARAFEAEKQKLVALIERSAGMAPAATAVHPFFGRLKPAEWSRLLWLHLDHHLRQFGV